MSYIDEDSLAPKDTKEEIERIQFYFSKLDSNNDDQSGKIHVLVAKRFQVEVKGYSVKMKAIKKALDEINIRKLEKMKDFGVKN